MSQEITKNLADGAVTLAVSSGVANKLGWFAFININAPALGVMTSVFFGLVATLFYYLNHRKTSGQEENTKKIKELEKQISLITERNRGK